MCSPCLERPLLALCLAWLPAVATLPLHAEPAPALRVCADPDNLPFSHANGSGFENQLAALLADEMGAELEIAWLPQWRGFVRKGITEGACDVLMGVPAGFERVATTRPYYRSSYAFVQRADAAPPLLDFGDPRLAALRIGVQLVGNDLAATPPGHALALHHAVKRVQGFPVLGAQPAAERIVQAVAQGGLDAGLVWGPGAGWFARHSPVPMRVDLAQPPADLPLPFSFAIAVGVRQGDEALLRQLDQAIARRHADIDALLRAHGVPLLPLVPATAASEPRR